MEAALRHPKSLKLSDRQIAEHVGVSDWLVRQKRSICETLADAPSTREVTRNGKTYEMNVGGINENRQPRVLASEIGEDETEPQTCIRPDAAPAWDEGDAAEAKFGN